MNDQLWAGVQFKLECGQFHLTKMQEAIDPPRLDQWMAAVESSGAIIGTGWHRKIFTYFDAFLAAVRSVPEVITCCFGADTVMQEWFAKILTDEQQRRKRFSAEFDPARETFRRLPLSIARNISYHRSGTAPVTVAVTGAFGAVYIGSPTKSIPLSEMREVQDPSQALLLSKPRRIDPKIDEFEIGGLTLFPACIDYLSHARTLVEDARDIADRVHGSATVSFLPDHV
jgi:hypothetical protein